MEAAHERRWQDRDPNDDDVVAAERLREMEGRIRDLERRLGRKTMEVEFLKAAKRSGRSPARGKKPVWQLASPPPW
jgi:transposase